MATSCSVTSHAAAALPPLCDTQNSLRTSTQLEQLSFTLAPYSTVTGRSGGPRSSRRASTRLTNSRRTRGGLAQRCGRGFHVSVHVAHYLRPPGRDFSDYREPRVNLIRCDGPQARKGASVKSTAASLLLRNCGLCGHRCVAQGELNRLSRLSDQSKKP